jgi:hypothetical protein
MGLRLRFRKTADEATGNYRITFEGYDGSVWTAHREYNSGIGARLVAGGLAFEDVGRADAMEGTITYIQNDRATNGGLIENVSASRRMERNKGFGMLAYELTRRQALEFEGNSYTDMEIYFSTSTDVIARFVAIAETDGKQGFSETVTSNTDFCTTASYPNHHAGIFADTPHPDFDHSLATPSMTDVAVHNSGHHSTALAAAAHWIASAAGWAWKHKTTIVKVLNKAPSYYQAMMNYGGSVVNAGGQIMAIGARAAPLAIGI